MSHRSTILFHIRTSVQSAFESVGGWFRQSPAPPPAGRRKLLGSLGLMPLLGLFGPIRRSEAKDDVDAMTKPTFVKRSDTDDYYRLKKLDLDSEEAKATQALMPKGKIAGRELGRLISGSNLISMNMHARDLDYVSNLARAYNTEERIFMTLKKCEELGCDSVVLKDHNFKHFRMADYWSQFGGKMVWHADVITTDIKAYERRLEQHLELGAWSVYLWGGATDIWYYRGEKDSIIKAYEIMRRYDVPVGIGAHRLEPIKFCEEQGLEPDYYIKTLHHDRYWSAHPAENRRFMEMYEPESPRHEEYHDNMFCHNHDETVEFMQDVRAPWIAFKVLAAGAIKPEDGIQYAFNSGADFICLGMFDFQVEEDARLIRKCVEKAKNRKRPWA
jgi:hypothetical protein